MWEAFKQGYKEANPDPLSVTLGRVIGLLFQWSACTAMVIWTARALGVGV